jgi:hypothetical protein
LRRAAVAAAIAASILAGCGGSNAPDLAANSNESLGFPARVGKPFGFGLPVLRNRSDEPVTLKGASLDGGSGGLEVLRTQAAGEDRRLNLVANSLQLPYINRNQHPHPLEGAVVAPATSKAGRRGVEVILTLRAPAKGRYAFDGLRVDFSQNGDSFSKTFPYPVRICATASRLERHCPVPKAPG